MNVINESIVVVKYSRNGVHGLTHVFVTIWCFVIKNVGHWESLERRILPDLVVSYSVAVALGHKSGS